MSPASSPSWALPKAIPRTIGSARCWRSFARLARSGDGAAGEPRGIAVKPRAGSEATSPHPPRASPPAQSLKDDHVLAAEGISEVLPEFPGDEDRHGLVDAARMAGDRMRGQGSFQEA